MTQSPARVFARRTAFALILALQITHFTLHTLDRWTAPRKPSPKLTTAAKLNELGFISITCFRIAEHSVDVQLGRWLVRGLGIEALLYTVAVWSAACVAYDAVVTPDSLVSLVQLTAVDVLMWTDMLSRNVGLVERKKGGYQAVAGDEKGGFGMDEVREKTDEKMGEKMEV